MSGFNLNSMFSEETLKNKTKNVQVLEINLNDIENNVANFYPIESLENSNEFQGLITSISLSGVAPEKGVGYKFPLTYGNNYPSSLKSGRIDAEIYKTSGTGSANVTLKYVHTKIGIGSPSFGFSGSGPSISISIISTYDTKEAYSSWNY